MLQEVRVTNRTPPEMVNLFSIHGEQSFTFVQPNNDPRVSGLVAGVPLSFLEMYADIALRHALVEEVEPGQWFAEVKGISGAWGDGASGKEATDELREAVLGWVALKLKAGIDVPGLAGFDLNPTRGREQAS